MSKELGAPSRFTAKCFVPEILVDFIQKKLVQGREHLEPSSFFLQGVCLLVDISGFTKLSGEFCDRGKNGIDDLQLATNVFMGKLVEVIYKFGGDIIKFAGDAIICVFSPNLITSLSFGNIRGSFCGFESSTKDNTQDQNPLILLEVILRAMHCAQLLRGIQTDKLSVHVAISCGELCFGILGGVENRWECLISGECIHELAACLDDAGSKEAAISAKCGELIKRFAPSVEPQSPARTQPQSAEAQGGAETLAEEPTPPSSSQPLTQQRSQSCITAPTKGTPQYQSIDTMSGQYEFILLSLPSGNQKIVDVKCETSVAAMAHSVAQSQKTQLGGYNDSLAFANLIHQFVPIPIADELQRGEGLNYIAEIREVTTMFMKWESYDPSHKHRDLLDLQAAFYQAQAILHNTGAFLRQFLVDDKGCVLIACWGMPHMSYLDNSNRALSAAAQIRATLYPLGMTCSFGITTGDVYCGTVGSVLRAEYAAIGSVVNMAARLMGKAHGGILIDDVTYSRLPGNLLEWLAPLAPLTVKGREAPLQVYQYIARESAHVASIREEAVEDHEISAACKTALLGMLNKMYRTAPEYATQGPKFASMKRQASVITKLPIVILDGMPGSGKTTTIMWLKRQAQDRSVSVVSLRLNKKDSLTDFSVWKRLFPLLMPKDLFLNNRNQQMYVKTLLKEVYPNDPTKAACVVMPVLKDILGITCTYTGTGNNNGIGSFSDNITSSRTSAKSSKSLRLLFARDPKVVYSGPPVPVQDTIYSIFSYLLNVQTTLIVVQNIEMSDEASLKLLVEMTALMTRSSIVLTALIAPEATDQRTSMVGKFFQTKSLTEDAVNSTAWARKYKDLLVKQRLTTIITLENYTTEEMDKMLCAVLGVRTVPVDIAQLVHDFSGGSYFWVREIMHFLKDHGPEQFMNAIGENDVANDMLLADSTSIDENSVNRPMSPPPMMRKKSFAVPAPMVRGVSNGALLQRTNSIMRPVSRGQSFKTLASHRPPPTHFQVQLNKLIMCRFESLHTDVQRVLRTASIIGINFSGHILYGVLPTHLKQEMPSCMKCLLNLRWLYQDTEDQNLYQFAHPLAHQIIYELTPTSERRNMHRTIADYIEETCGDDKALYGTLSFHYQHYDTDKALRYAVQATPVLLESDQIFDYADCVDLLFGSCECCRTIYDTEVLRKLVDSASRAISKFQPKSKAVVSTSWTSMVMRIVRPVTARLRFRQDSSVHPSSNTNIASSANTGATANAGAGAGAGVSGGTARSTTAGKGTRAPIDSSALVTTEDGAAESYDMELKRNYLAQLASLNAKLTEKADGFSTDAVNSVDIKDWQRPLLGIIAKPDSTTSMFGRLRSRNGILTRSMEGAELQKYAIREEKESPEGKREVKHNVS